MQIYFCYIQVCMIAMVCCEGARRKAPTNYIFLGVFTGMQNFQYYCIGSEMTFIRDPGLICLVILLNLILAAEGLMLGSVCVYFDADAVLIAVGICAAVTLALTLFAFQVRSLCVLS